MAQCSGGRTEALVTAVYGQETRRAY
jgi:hypothetical protein